MIISTHTKIASLIYDQFTEEERKIVSKTSYIDGSKFPDLNYDLRKIKHTFEGSIDFVCECIEQLLSRKQSRKEFGHLLGVISHFMADYACAYHSNPNFTTKHITSHIAYEMRINSISEKVKVLKHQYVSFQSLSNLKEELQVFLTNNYNEKKANPAKDYLYATSITKAVVDMIVVAYKNKYVYDLHGIDYKPRIAIFTDTYFPHINGVSNTLYQYIQFLEQNNIQYILFSPRYKSVLKDKEEGYNIEKIRGVHFALYPEAVVSFPNRLKMRKILKEFDPEIIHCMTEFTLGYFGMKYAKKHNIKVVSNYSTNITQYLKYFKIQFLEKTTWRYFRWFHNRASVTFCPSNETKKYLENNGINKVMLFGRGITTEIFSPMLRNVSLRKEWNAENKKILLYVGRVSPEKDLSVLMESYKILKRKYSDKVALVITGAGPLLDEIKDLNLNDVIFTGFKTGKELHEIYASCDIFTFPSPTETLGNVVLEAMASGLPVVGVNSGGVKDNIKNMYNGLLPEPKDVTQYTNAISCLLDDENLYNELSRNALLYAKTKNWTSVFKGLLFNYQEQV